MNNAEANNREAQTLAIASESYFAPWGVVAIAGSAGSLAVLLQLLSQLPACFPVPIIILRSREDPRHKERWRRD
ncbi:MAG: hypothetical protein ACLFT0_20600, partial [Spirulinaceae cyanobacterium]